MSYLILENWPSKEEEIKIWTERSKGHYKIYGFEYDLNSLNDMDITITTNCFNTFGNELFSSTNLANRIVKDAITENGNTSDFSSTARFIAIMFKQAILENKISTELKQILEDYIYNNKKNYNFKMSYGYTIFRNMYDSAMCYAEAIYWEILNTTESDILGLPIFLTYRQNRYSKCNELKPNEDGTKLISCSPEEAKAAAGYDIGPWTKDKQKAFEKREKEIDELTEKFLKDGYTQLEIIELINNMRKNDEIE